MTSSRHPHQVQSWEGRSPIPIWFVRFRFVSSAAAVASADASRLASSTIAALRFCHQDRCPSDFTTTPVGIWVIRTAESVTLRCWPPAPDPRKDSIEQSDSFRTVWVDVASTSATVIVEL